VARVSLDAIRRDCRPAGVRNRCADTVWVDGSPFELGRPDRPPGAGVALAAGTADDGPTAWSGAEAGRPGMLARPDLAACGVAAGRAAATLAAGRVAEAGVAAGLAAAAGVVTGEVAAGVAG
jgi:hypothetical protein